MTFLGLLIFMYVFGYVTKAAWNSVIPEMKHTNELETKEDILAFLESCSTVDSEAKELTVQFCNYINSNKQLESGEESWKHTTNIIPPSKKHWELVLESINFEPTESGKLESLGFILDRKAKFTDYECQELIKLFVTQEFRTKARLLILGELTLKIKTNA